MRISVTFRHMEPTDAIKDYVVKKLNKVNRYLDEPIEATVVLSLEKYRNIAEVTLSAGRNVINCTESTDDIYSAVDKTLDKLERQIKKQKQKVRSKKNRTKPDREAFVQEAEAQDEAAEQQPDWEKKIAVSETADLKPIGLEEAVMWMEDNPGADFLMFTNSHDNRVNVIYRRKQGDFGLIQANNG